MSARAPSVSVVMPTYNRLPALRENLPPLLALPEVTEVVVVIDGSTDGTRAWLEELHDLKLKVIEQPHSGSPTARNTGVAHAAGTWILMTEDDCSLPVDYVRTVLTVAEETDADIVGAPWVTVSAGDAPEARLRRARAAPEASIGLATHPGVFPVTEIETPFLCGVFLARRELLRQLPYRVALGGNAWREETDLFLRATETGHRCVLTPRTAALQTQQWVGGQRRARFAYELWVMRNNWTFLRRHAVQLRGLGQIRSPAGAQLSFVTDRLRSLALGFLRARLPTVRARA